MSDVTQGPGTAHGNGTGTVAPPPPAAPQLVLPARALPRAPSADRILSRALVLAGVALALWLLDGVADVLMDFWLLESLGYEDVFWTNFSTQAVLFGVVAVGALLAVVIPARYERLSRRARRRAAGIGLLVGLLSGVWAAGQYREILLLLNGREFGADDPVFGNDIGFYVFDLGAIRSMVELGIELGLIAVAASATCALLGTRGLVRHPGLGRIRTVLGRAASPLTLAAIGVVGILVAADVWLERYDLLTKDNTDSSVPAGAQALDVSGLFSTRNLLVVETLAALAATVGAITLLRRMRRAVTREDDTGWLRTTSVRRVALAFAPGLTLTLVFLVGVAVRDDVQIQPNEPVVQLDYIQRHIAATNRAWSMDRVETRPFTPNASGDPKPALDDVMASPAVRNAPLWPGYHSRLERQVDPEYLERITLKQGDPTIYGPTLQTYQQQQQLRPYYDFMDVDTVRYKVDGQSRLFASSVRELPLVEPQPWLAWWGQRFVVFTHGSGLVMNLLAGVSPEGYPQYASRDIPSKVDVPQLAVQNPSVYYGEGAGSMAYSNVKGVQEHDFPTADGRAEVSYPQDVRAGVELDSPLKRAVFGWKSRQFLEIFFSDLVDDQTRVHYFRTPLERLEQVAPFLWGDTDPYAIADGDRIRWMVNGLTTSTAYPYSMSAELGDKSDSRTPTPRPTRTANYAQDSVKAVVDAYTGQIDLYRWKREPVVDTWADVYPDLFKDRDAMPQSQQEQVQYPVQLMHAQFDDLYIYSHMKDPLTFFSQEDLLDDGDEVVGPLLSEGESVNFSIEPYYWIADTGKGALPRAAPPQQFAMSTIFTPENALNLRAIVTAYQEGRDYGRLSMLEVPKGEFHPGPEQADAAIDQDPFISQQIALWSRRGLEVIRGHTTPLLVENELFYVEPLFVRSVQNPVPQLERVVVVFRGDAFMGETLRDAMREALEGRAKFPIRPGPELGGEPGFEADGTRSPVQSAGR